jgi:hypothetical protein
MQNMQNVKTVGITPPAAIIDNAAATTASVDTKGFSKARIVVYLGALDIAVSAMKLRHSDDDSTYSDISGADFSVSPLTLPSATDDNHSLRSLSTFAVRNDISTSRSPSAMVQRVRS